METLHCEHCDQDFQRPRQRGRKPRLCPTCKAREEAAKEANAPTAGGFRRKFEKTYTPLDGEIEEQEYALYIPYHMFPLSREKAVKHAKEVFVDSVDREQGFAHVRLKKEIVPAKLENLYRYEMKKVEISDNPEEEMEENDATE